MKNIGPYQSRLSLNLFGLIIVAALVIAAVKRYSDEDLLFRTASVTDGSVNALRCSDHGGISFTYKVDGVVYERNAIAAACGLPSCGKAVIGNRVRVIYSREKPALATCETPQARQDGTTRQFLVFGLLAVSVGFGLWRLKFTPQR